MIGLFIRETLPAERRQPMVGGAVLVWFSWHAIFWILALVALLPR